MKEITIVETIQAAPGKTEALKQALSDLVPICRASKGCLQYDLFEPIGEKGQFLVLMRWKNNEAWQGHREAKHIAEFVRKYDRIVYVDAIETEWHQIL